MSMFQTTVMMMRVTNVDGCKSFSASEIHQSLDESVALSTSELIKKSALSKPRQSISQRSQDAYSCYEEDSLVAGNYSAVRRLGIS